MAMKMVSLRCPNCGKTVTLEKGQKMCFCTYCGSQLFLDDGSKNVNITHNHNHNFTFRKVDETKIRTAEIESDNQRRKLENDRHEVAIGLAILAFTIVFAIIGIGFLAFLERDNKEAHNREVARLEKLADELQTDIEDRDYDSARIKANQLHYTLTYSPSTKEHWDEYREDTLELIDKLQYGSEHSSTGETSSAGETAAGP